MNYYELLEISPAASIEIIRNAYKTLAKKYHPDTYQGDTSFAEEKMKLLNEAISVLEDESKRKEYNKINGISQSGRNNMLNVDENGESIFFSYGMDDDDDAGDNNDTDIFSDEEASYMDIIDNFINENKPETKTKKKSPKNSKKKEKENTVNIDDAVIIDDISSIDSGYIDMDNDINAAVVEYPDDDLDYVYENQGYTEDGEDEYGEEEYETVSLRSKPKSKNKSLATRTRLYYVVLAFLISANVFLFALILKSVDLENITKLFSGLSGKMKNSDDDKEADADFTFEDDGDPTTDVAFIMDTTSDTTESEDDIPQPITQENTITAENTTVTESPVTATTTQTQRPTNPPVVKPPVTQPPATTAEPVITTETPVVKATTEETIPETTTEAPAIETETEPETTLESVQADTTEESTVQGDTIPLVTEPEPTEPLPEETVSPVDPENFDVNEEE